MAPALDSPDIPSLTACLAGVRAAMAHANAAADAWSERNDHHGLVDTAYGALARAKAQADAMRQVLPGHARRVRLASRAIERAEEALAVVRALPPAIDLGTEPEEEQVEDEEMVLEAVERAFGAVERAVVAATPTVASATADS